ncbi:putative quinol monooxygenase [Algoriphagus marinus]|uniref:putative quinol monooxygenase n=1 Tax=Algoriphagus marinus TaxID=1925762 RepID=UPI00094BA9B8|nr:putative quinol monooxygenase [Algoriphagus marinus]
MTVCNLISKLQLRFTKVLSFGFCIILLVLTLSTPALAQERDQMVRFAKIKVDPLQLVEYTTALKEQMETAVRVEQGVLSYHAVADKSDPTTITILEIYADSAAYQTHILTPHFLKYKETVKDMVKSLELVDLNIIGIAKKPDH